MTKLNPVLIDTEEDPIYFKVRYVSDLQSKMPLPVLEIPTCLIMYVKQSREDIFTPLVCHPGNLVGFTLAYSRKFCVDPRSIRTLFKHIETTDSQVTHVDDELFSTFANKTFMIRVVSFLNDRHHRVFDIILYDFGLY